jgi:hypothetical protein
MQGRRNVIVNISIPEYLPVWVWPNIHKFETWGCDAEGQHLASSRRCMYAGPKDLEWLNHCNKCMKSSPSWQLLRLLKQANLPSKQKTTNPALRYKIIREDDKPSTINVKQTKRVESRSVTGLTAGWWGSSPWNCVRCQERDEWQP